MRDAVTTVVRDLIQQDKNVLALTADNGNDIYYEIKSKYPSQFLDYGIAECNMLASAAGLAANGFIPFIFAISNFLSMRGFEFLRNAICGPKYNVKILGGNLGFSAGHMGMTHQATEDFAILRTLENLLTIYPASPIEAREAARYAYAHNGPVYICFEARREPEIYSDEYKFTPGKASTIRAGTDLTIICVGSIINEAIAASELVSDKWKIRIIDMPVVKPIDRPTIIKAAQETGAILTLEEQTLYGGLGSAVAEVLAEEGIGIPFKRMGLEGTARVYGIRSVMRARHGLDASYVAQSVADLMQKKAAK